MSESYEVDRIENEREDPVEGSSLRFVNVPLVLISGFLGFGISYLALRTPSVDFHQGDSRSQAVSLASPQPPPDLRELGGRLYKNNCQACHQQDGKGLATTFPPLAGSQWVTGDPETLSAILLHGVVGEIEVQGQVFNGVMPAFKSTLSHGEVAAIATYIRSAWGNQSGEVTQEVVAKVAQATAQRKQSWAGGKELKAWK